MGRGGDGAAFDHRDGFPAHPAVFADQGDRGRGGWGEGESGGLPTRGQGGGRKEIKGLGVGVRERLGIGYWPNLLELQTDQLGFLYCVNKDLTDIDV